MFQNLKELKRFTIFSVAEQNLLTSWRRPIVLLNYKKGLAPSVNNDFHRMGVMLPYMPFHYQLMEKLNTPAVVLTSGNLSDEPIILDNELAIKSLAAIADAFLVYNRDIFNRVDDSVSFVVNNKPRLIRRSRGFVPTPIRTKLNIDGIFAAGAELVNCFAIGKDKLALVSQHIGDLQNFETYEFYEETIEKYKHLFRLQTELVAVDMHPDYFSTRYGKKLGLKTVEVQHHHAHVASCMAEHGLDEKVIGVSLDGTGYGDDGHIWGSEFFICDLNTYQRETHFDYIPLPGGDAVTKEPWRTALSYLYTYFGKDFLDLGLDFLKDIPKAKIDLIIEAIDKNINAPLSSSCGRLFDTVSALINLCTVSKFHAEAPMRLESIASPNITESYPFDHGQIISFEPTFRGIINDLKNNTQPGIISAKFHNTVINVIFDTVNKIRENTGINKVVLSGGTFQNAILLRETERKLIENKFEVFAHQKVPSNDGGIALGQLAIAAKRRELKCV
jgi:hydrogenase maturation protein HypF